MITCCRYCVPPKRNAICHSYCKDYRIEKECHEEERLRIRKIKNLDSAFSQKIVEQKVKQSKKKNQKRIKNYSN